MKEREGNFELELKVSSFELLVNSFELYTALPLTHCGTIRIRKSSSQQEIFEFANIKTENRHPNKENNEKLYMTCAADEKS